MQTLQVDLGISAGWLVHPNNKRQRTKKEKKKTMICHGTGVQDYMIDDWYQFGGYINVYS